MKSDEQFLREVVAGEITFHIMKGMQTFTKDGFEELLRGIVQITDRGASPDEFDQWLGGEIHKIRDAFSSARAVVELAVLLMAMKKVCVYPEAARCESMQDIRMRVCEVLGLSEVGWSSYLE